MTLASARLLPVLLVSTAAATAPGLAATPLASVVRVAGPVDVRQAGSWRDANTGDKLGAGDAVRTGQRGYATLRDQHGTVTELFPLASVEFPRDTAIGALAGRIWTHFRKIPGLTREIKTPSAVALIRGTTLAVEASGGQTRVTVLEGLVEVRDLEGKSALVPDGYTIRADRSGLGRVERALEADLTEGRQFLDRSRTWLGPDAPVPGGGTLLPGGNSLLPGIPVPAGVPAAAPGAGPGRRPSALERAEAELDARRREAGAASGAGGAGVGLQGAGAAVRDQSGSRAEGNIRAGVGPLEPAGRADSGRVDTGRVDPVLRGDPPIRAEVGLRSEPPARGEPGTSIETRGPVDVRIETGVRAEPAPQRDPVTRSEPVRATEPEAPAAGKAQDPSAGRKDPALEIDIRNRPDILGR